MVKHTQTILQKLMNFLSVFDHFVGLALKGIKMSMLWRRQNFNYVQLHVFQNLDYYIIHLFVVIPQ